MNAEPFCRLSIPTARLRINLYFFSSYLFLLEPDLCIILLDLCYFSFLKGSCELQVQTVEEAGYAQYPRNSTRARRFAATN
jgi:hypothetical protein